MLEVHAIVALKCTLEVEADQQKILYYWTKYAFLQVIYSLSIFSLGNIRTPGSDAPKIGTVFSAFIVDEIYIFVCRYVELFRSYVLSIDGSGRNLTFFPGQIFRGGVFFSKVGFKV